MSIRVRYAPSPTGKQHIGGIRTALFDYFFARANNGTFILRIEDTDRERFHKDALQDIYDSFHWLGITWDEGPDKGGPFGPYLQSMRKDLYQNYALELIEKGAAYYCYCTPERLDSLRNEQQKRKKGETGYDRHCRDLTETERKSLEEKGTAKVIRLKIPLEGEVLFHDELLGDIKTMNKDINPDPVLLKSDGFPTYHLAHVVDDHLMEITHILRAQEWLSSAPLHILMFQAFGWKLPKFYHLPLVLGNDGHKLAKRHGSTSITEFREKGYLPEAIMNYVSLLGWSYDDSRVFFSKEDLEQLFSLEKLNKAPAVFDFKKLEWFNGQYIRKKSGKEIISLVKPYLKKAGFIHEPATEEEEKIIKGMIPLIHERLHVLSDVTELAGFLFHDPVLKDKNEFIPKRLDREKTLQVLEACAALLSDFDSRTDTENEESFRNKALELQVKLGDFLLPLRIALTGSRVSPPLFESIRLLGVEKTKERVKQALSFLSQE
ncbi:MAG: glutamate--tRNA ligase [Spirochaetales bacterium]|nr:glutamate--tRNA ligase [Spirochaetales bacterium]